ncbi:MAG: class I SAM-dependent methyltransferase [Candidatus Omnitrophota bacterium]
MHCRICKSERLRRFLDLGSTPAADDFLTPQRLKEPEASYPLEAYICGECSLVQLGYVVPPEVLFQKDYPYESSMTETGVKHFHSFAKEVAGEFKLTAGDLAVDIGSNVGVLLEGFKKLGIGVLGVEPAPNICKIASQRGIETLNTFFNEDTVSRIIDVKGKAKIITGTNVVAHIDDLHALLNNIDRLLTEEGVFIFEAPYLVNLIENREYDTIYHEHLSYLSVKPLVRLFNMFDMEIFDINKQSIHGGSLRYFASRKNDYNISGRVGELLALEEERRIYDIKVLEAFAQDIRDNKTELTRLLQSLKKSGKRIAGVGAPAKGMTLLNYCGIGTGMLDFITEKSKLKIGKYTPGTHIPVLPDSELLKERPDFALLLSWNFADEIMANLKDYAATGGKFIIPIPRPHIAD